MRKEKKPALCIHLSCYQSLSALWNITEATIDRRGPKQKHNPSKLLFVAAFWWVSSCHSGLNPRIHPIWHLSHGLHPAPLSAPLSLGNRGQMHPTLCRVTTKTVCVHNSNQTHILSTTFIWMWLRKSMLKCQLHLIAEQTFHVTPWCILQ